MINKYNLDDTIVALATPNGVGAISIIRLSGLNAIVFTQSVFSNSKLQNCDSHTVHYGFIQNFDKEKIDEVLVSVFRAPKSFTTQDIVEISSHGSPFIVEQIIQIIVSAGARLAEPGEFTLRAFLMGRIDLSQAEAVADLITSQNKAQQKIALNQLKGGLSHDIAFFRNQLLQLTSLLELELDFAEEDVAFADRTTLKQMVQDTILHLNPIIDSFQYGNAIKHGIPVAIVGRPNAGKSSLLNVLLNENRAIVTAIAGTTRDTIEEQFTIEGITFRLIDTAGIRNTSDEVEKIGVEKTHETIEKASIIIFLYDVNQQTNTEVIEDVKKIYFQDKKYIVCANKIDMLIEPIDNEVIQGELRSNLKDDNLQYLSISALEKNNLESLKEKLIEDYKKNISSEQTILSNQRHYQSMLEARQALQDVQKSMEENRTTDLIALDLKRSLFALSEVSGAITNDEILGNIFSQFCIGK